MGITIAVAFLVGVFVGIFGGTLVLSLCAMAGREDSALDPALSPLTK